MANLAQIYDWFMTGKKPTQAQFWASWASFWNKGEQIPQSAISGLATVLNAKAENDQFNAHKTAADAHADLFAEKEDKANKGIADGYAPLDEFTKITHEYLNIINDLVTGGATALLSAEQGKLLQTQINNINVLLTSDNVNLDNVQELVDAIETIQMSFSTILVNDLTTGGTTKALTAEMGKTLKGLIDTLSLLVNKKVDKEEGSRLISSAEIIKLAALRNTTTVEGTYDEIKALANTSSLTLNTRYIITDYQTKYFIGGSNSSGIVKNKLIGSFVSGWAVFSDLHAYDIYIGLPVVITKLPDGYVGSLVVGGTATVTNMASNVYFKFSNGMQNVVGLELKYSLTRYQTIAPDAVINDAHGKPVMKPGGVINTEVHDGTAYMDQTALENLAVPIERIVLVPSSSNQFEAQGVSDTFKGDIIWYDINDTTIANDNNESIGVRKGFVYKRFNEKLNIECDVDWRVVRYRRWLLSTASRISFINQDLDPATTRVGYQSKFLFTSDNRTSTAVAPFYIAKSVEGKLLNLDANAMAKEFTYTVHSNASAKDLNIFLLDVDYMPVAIDKFKVGSIYNTVFMGLDGEFSKNLNIDTQYSVMYGNTFVSNGSTRGNNVTIYNTTMLDNFEAACDNAELTECQFLSYASLQNISNSQVSKCIFGTVLGKLTGTGSGITPSVGWNVISCISASYLTNSVFGQATAKLFISDSKIDKSQLFVYDNNIGNNKCVNISGSIFTKLGLIMPRSTNGIGFDGMYFKDSNPLRTDGLFLYNIGTGEELSGLYIKLNKYNYKLYYEDLDASDVRSITTFATVVV
jgi:hypothetical protein